jgi:hypothetical protein
MLLLVFVVARTAFFEHADALFHIRIPGMRMSVLLEIGGSLVICIGARMRAMTLTCPR